MKHTPFNSFFKAAALVLSVIVSFYAVPSSVWAFDPVLPESEPETQAMVALCNARLPRMLIALHSQGREIFWRYGERLPPDSRALAELFSAASGYKLSDNAGLASFGGFKDWFIAAFNKPGYTVEIGVGRNPLPLTDWQTRRHHPVRPSRAGHRIVAS